MSNEEIVEQIQKGIDVAGNQERLWKNNERFVRWVIRKYVGNCCKEDLEDFMQQGFIGIVSAAGRYRPEGGAKFLTYAESHIKTAIFRYNGCNTSSVHIPEYLKTRMRKLAAFKREYREEFHREPDPEEIQRTLHISRRSLCHLEKTMLNMRTKSLDEYISDDGDTKLIDMLSTDERIDELAGGSEYQRELHKELEAALSILDDKTALMIKCAYYQRNNYARTAEIFGCSRQAVDERIKKGFYKILHSKHREKLESFMWEGYHANPRRLSNYADMEEIDNMGSEFLL
ncbi:MAG: sigma-70 family RNA polymerase sigma factor [Acetatifactor muris]|nr:sigma-70 family RNA polymerase sigma factor [Acetatifactor muris]